MRRFMVCTMALVLIVFATPLFAQGLTGKGVKAGLSSSLFTNDIFGDTDRKAGICAGGFLTFQVTPNLAIQPELLYAQRGGKYVTNATNEMGEVTGEVDANYNFDYLELPVLLRVSATGGGKVSPAFFAGPSLAFKLSSTSSASGDPVLQDVSNEESDMEWIRSTDLRLTFGAGLDIDAGSNTIFLEGRYDVGLSNLNDSEGPAVMKHRIITILAGIGF